MRKLVCAAKALTRYADSFDSKVKKDSGISYEQHKIKR